MLTTSVGHCYLMMDELQQAYSAYQSALYNLKDPNVCLSVLLLPLTILTRIQEPKLWYGIGILYDRYGSLDHAEEAFSQVMRMAPDFDKANEIYFRLGIIYKQQSKYGESLECFRWIVSNPPAPLNQTDIWFQIGHVYEQQKDVRIKFHNSLAISNTQVSSNPPRELIDVFLSVIQPTQRSYSSLAGYIIRRVPTTIVRSKLSSTSRNLSTPVSRPGHYFLPLQLINSSRSK